MKTLSTRSGHHALPLWFAALSLVAVGCGDDGGGGGGTDDSGTGTGAATDDPDTGVADETGTDTDDDDLELNVVPAPGGVRRLTPNQYVESVRVMFGNSGAEVAAPPPLPQLGSFDSQTTVEQPLTPVDIELYESSAMAIGTAMQADPSGMAEIVQCVVESPNPACYTDVARDLGRVAWRRPLLDEEIDTLVSIAEAGQEWGDGDFGAGLKYELSAILQSPNFLYIGEVGEPLGEGEVRELDQYELAARLSFFMLGRTPNVALLDAAEAGELGTDQDIRALAADMLTRPEARDRVAEFYDELYKLRDLETKGKDETLFPTFSPELAAAMRQETLLLIQDVVFEQNGNFLDVLDSNYTFVNDDLAALYGISPPAFPWQQVPLPVEQGRAGFLTQPAFLTVFSHPDINSPTRRGLFVQETLLCTEIQPPPPSVNPMPPAPTEGQTLREWMEVTHNSDETCASCHGLMDPLGYAFEHFDPMGASRELDNGLPIDSSGDVDGLGAFADAMEMVELVRNDPRTPGCVVRNLYRSTLGYHEGIEQAEGIATLDEAFEGSDYNYQDLMVELTVNPLFRLVDAPK